MEELFSVKEKKIINEYQDNGFLILDAESKESVVKISKEIFRISSKEINFSKNYSLHYFNNYHKFIGKENLNPFRLSLIEKINKIKSLKEDLYKITSFAVNTLLGNELMIQRKINLSIQLPNDHSSLLDIHADTWGGNSPFELNIWLPLVDCCRTKSIFILPKKDYILLEKELFNHDNPDSEKIFISCKKYIKYIDIKFGQVLIFDPKLPHGNRLNDEHETRWSLNYRFKSVFSPYADKKIGEYFEPLILRPCTINGMDYQHPFNYENS